MPMEKFKLDAGQRKRPVTLSISEGVMDAVASLDLNASRVAEAGLIEAVRKAIGEKWVKDNQDFIEAHNKRVEEHGVMLPPDWLPRT